jgi:phenylacetaldehyde dehydrogenase
MTSDPSALRAAMSFIERDHGLLIGGRWGASRSGETFASRNPATGQHLATLALGDPRDVDLAVAAARDALNDPAWRDITPLQRGELLHRLAELVEEHADELAIIESLDNGKPVAVARAVDVGATIKLFRYFAGWPSKFEGATIPVSPRDNHRNGVRVPSSNATTHSDSCFTAS